MVDVKGACGPSGTQYYRICSGQNIVWLEVEQIGSTQSEALKTLSSLNIKTTYKMDQDNIWRDLCGKAPLFNGEIIENLGWNHNGKRFGLRDGNIVGPTENTACEPVYSFKNMSRPVSKGTVVKWRRFVARRLTGQHIPMFALMTPMASPLLDLLKFDYAPCFELCGKKGIGKTTIQRLAGAFYGPQAWPNQDTPSYTLAQFLNDPKEAINASRDMFLNIDEADPHTADVGDREAASIYKTIAFRADQGIDPFAAQRSIMLISTNRPLFDLVGIHSETGLAASNRIFTIPIDPDNRLGVFNRKHKEFEGVVDYASALMTASRQLYGTAGQKYLNRLVSDRNTDPAKLIERLQASIAEFRATVKVDSRDGDAVRKADAFGIVYAAGKLAQSYAILPRLSWDCLEAVHRCYTLYTANRNVPEPFSQRLDRIAQNSKVVDLNSNPSNDIVKKANVFIKNASDARELIIRPNYIAKVFSDWKQLSKTRSVVKLRVRDKDNPSPKRTLPHEKASRFVVFRLPKPQ